MTYIKITRETGVFDITNPERIFKKNTVLKVNDPDRAKKILELKYGTEQKTAKEYEELDPTVEKAEETNPILEKGEEDEQDRTVKKDKTKSKDNT